MGGLTNPKKLLSPRAREAVSMVKGVSKGVIEVTLTESSLFERAILFVKPEKRNLGEQALSRRAEEYVRLSELTQDSLPVPAAGSKGALAKKLLQWTAAAAVGAAAVLVFC